MLNFLQNNDIGKLLLRLTVGVLILFHGIAKTMHLETLDWIGGQLAELGLPAALSYGVFVGEIIGAVMVILGLYTRLGGLFIFINMIFALVLAHTQEFLSLSDHGGWAIELQVFFLMNALAVIFLGSGRFAIKPDDDF